MDNGFKDAASLLLIMAFFLVPLIAPVGFIIIGAAGWTVAYILVALNSVTFSSAADLPYWVTSWDGSTVVLVIVFLTLLGFIRGPTGALAMLVVWGPSFIIPFFMISLGVGQYHTSGWWGYKQANYEERCYYDGSRRYLCAYRPLQGKKLPSFLEDHSVGANEKVLRVIPYGSKI